MPQLTFAAHPAAFHANYTALSKFYHRLRVFAAGYILTPPVHSTPAESSSSSSAGYGEGIFSAKPVPRTTVQAHNVITAADALARHPATEALRADYAKNLPVYFQVRVKQRLPQNLARVFAGPRGREFGQLK
jgi:hypothetical protein